ncbi:MAG: calcium/sodium antiporter [Chlorobi bacterium]|nr:calcium/sodium antiporter [Chlorobiota bacterium]
MIFLYVLVLLLSFYVLAKVVDDYFVPSLDNLSEKLKMSHDAAGATLMAIGSSAPELFVALFAVFRPGNHEAIGIGNIVGSALFNLLIVTGFSTIVRDASVAKHSVLRDLFFYVVSVGLLLLIFDDKTVSLYEAVLLIFVYGLYIFAVIKWKKLFPEQDTGKYEEPNVYDTDEVPKKNFLSKVVAPVDYLINLFFKPLKHYFAVFIVSVAFIAGISRLLVESAVHIASLSGIPEAFIAVTILAAGTSVPDLVSSVIVSKKGRGGMAISNAVGSNIFDILVGLGLPFLIFILISGENMPVNTDAAEESVYYLASSTVMVLILFLIFRWKVGKLFGILLTAMYVAYLIRLILFV